MKKNKKTLRGKKPLYGCELCEFESSKKAECCGEMMQPKKNP